MKRRFTFACNVVVLKLATQFAVVNCGKQRQFTELNEFREGYGLQSALMRYGCRTSAKDRGGGGMMRDAEMKTFVAGSERIVIKILAALCGRMPSNRLWRSG